MADSNITKKALADALRELIAEEPFSSISVADICAQCDMNRKSFYYHFKDKYDLVNWIFDTQFISVFKKQGFSFSWNSLLALARYFHENRAFYRKVLVIQGQNSFQEHFREILTPIIAAQLAAHSAPDPVSDFQTDLLVDILLLAFQRWLLETKDMSPEDFIAQLKEGTRHLCTLCITPQ